jgi:MFS family permease
LVSSVTTRQRNRLFDLPKPVWLMGWVSLATDSATEAVYPLLPFFLTRVLGADAVSLGIVEGAAEAANSVLKILSGWLADRSRAKRPLVLLGYSLSSAVRPLIAFATTWTQVFTVRVLDRVGKGVRGAPRDAMLATWTTPTTRGKVYGFHRAMDHLGAVIGPAAATLFLWWYPGAYRMLFALTIVPGAIAVLLILFIKERDEVRSDVVSGFRLRVKLRRTAVALAKAVSRTVTSLHPTIFCFPPHARRGGCSRPRSSPHGTRTRRSGTSDPCAAGPTPSTAA